MRAWSSRVDPLRGRPRESGESLSSCQLATHSRSVRSESLSVLARSACVHEGVALANVTARRRTSPSARRRASGGPDSAWKKE